MISKKALAIELSKLEGFYKPKISEEQYTTDSEIAADILWKAYTLGDIYMKGIIDIGCGTGILGIGAGMLGAKIVWLVDKDKNAIDITKRNILKMESESLFKNMSKVKWKYILKDINNEKGVGIKKNNSIDTVIQNPPFGTKIRHNDVIFLEKAAEISKVVYSMHKSETIGYIKNKIIKFGLRLTHIWDYNMPLKNTYLFHSKKNKRIKVSVIRCEKA